MPEIRFHIQWPDGTPDTCYSPSLVVKEYFVPGDHYNLADFVERSRTALHIASDRVQSKYGFPCSRALAQLHHIESQSAQYQNSENPAVTVLGWIEE